MTIAIAYPDTPNDVQLWCTVEKLHADGSIDFHVINGHWEGTLFPNNTMKVKETGKIWPAIKVWEGRVRGDKHYNDAILWINKQLRKNDALGQANS